MNITPVATDVLNPLERLSRRVRLRNWLRKLHRSVWLVAAAFLCVFLVDWLIGLRTVGLRSATVLLAALAVGLVVADWITAWLVRLDRVGLAQILESRYPELSERLVTLVQLDEEPSGSAFAPMLRQETEQRMAGVEATEACPIDGERRTWLRSLGFLALLAVGLMILPGFVVFADRFAAAWSTPLVPFAITVKQGDGHALRCGTFTVEAQLQRLDRFAEEPAQAQIELKSNDGSATFVPMISLGNGKFTATLLALQQPVEYKIRCGDAVSETCRIGIVEVPALRAKPAMIVTEPAYRKTKPQSISYDRAMADGILCYSKLRFEQELDRTPARASIRIASKNSKEATRLLSLTATNTGVLVAEDVVAGPGVFQAELVMELEHGLTATLPIGKWSVFEDSPPTFVQPLRLKGGGAALSTNKDYRISAGDALKLKTTVQDAEGLGAIELEFRINDAPPFRRKWLDGGGEKKLDIDHWLPLPGGLKAEDHVRFRVHVSDQRRMRKGEATASDGRSLPLQDLSPQTATQPAGGSGDDAWITLRVDPAVKDFFTEQVQAQTDDVRDTILKIRAKVESEADQVQQIQRRVHLQSALTPGQLEQAKELRALNREIALDLLAAADRFGKDPEIAKLAEHLLEIAETDILKSALALKQFSEPDRLLADAEKDLLAAHDSLLNAKKKLDRLLDWNKLLAQDRLDQFQIDKLIKRQDELAERLEKLLADDAKKDPEAAKKIDSIRAEQGQLADETEKLQGQSRLAQDAMSSLEQSQAQKLAKEAEALAAEQRAMNEAGNKLPKDIQDRLDKLAQRQTDLAQRVEPFAKESQGPSVEAATTAANALKKPNLDDAMADQVRHEKLLQEWADKLAPSVTANSLREQVLQLLKKQSAIRADLERLVKEVDQLDLPTVQKRLDDIAARQRQMPQAIAKLPIQDERLRSAQKAAEETTQQAAKHAARENAAGTPAAHKLMQRAEKELAALAELMPKSVPIERKEIKDQAVRKTVEQIDKFGREQADLRAETEQLKKDLAKASSGSGKGTLAEKTEKLAADLIELAQKASSPEAKAMAKESALAVEEAKKAMEAGQALKAKGDTEAAKKMDAVAEKQLEIAAKGLGKLAQDQSMKNMPKDEAGKAAESLKDGAGQMRKAEKTLPAQPKDAQSAMQSASKSLQQASKQAAKQAARMLPSAARTPANASALAGAFPGSQPKNFKLESFQGKAWGELPGELKTQMLQDIRSRFGEDYAEMIREYFERLSQPPRRP